MSFLSSEPLEAFELHELRGRVKSELAFIAAIEANCRKRLLSSALTGAHDSLVPSFPEHLGFFKLFKRQTTGVFVARTKASLPQLPLSSFFR